MIDQPHEQYLLPLSQTPVHARADDDNAVERRLRRQISNRRREVPAQTGTQMHRLMRLGRGAAVGGLGITMVSVGKLAARQANYYLEQAGARVSHCASVASGVEDYYASGREAAGRWIGRGSISLRLAGPVGAEQLRAVLDGVAPDGRQLWSSARTRVPGSDVTSPLRRA